jgi:hypothetical protein
MDFLVVRPIVSPGRRRRMSRSLSIRSLRLLVTFIRVEIWVCRVLKALAFRTVQTD